MKNQGKSQSLVNLKKQQNYNSKADEEEEEKDYMPDE